MINVDIISKVTKDQKMGETFTVRVEQDKATVRLLPILDMSASDEFLNVMRACVSTQNSLILDGEEVQRVSTPCVQVMLGADKAVQDAGGSFSIKNMSSDFERALRDLGLTEYIDKWSRI